MKFVLIALFSAALFLTSCSGCSKSGRRPTGQKTFVTGKVTNVKETSFLVDTNSDGKPDQEVTIAPTLAAPKKDTTITVVIQGHQMVDWYY